MHKLLVLLSILICGIYSNETTAKTKKNVLEPIFSKDSLHLLTGTVFTQQAIEQSNSITGVSVFEKQLKGVKATLKSKSQYCKTNDSGYFSLKLHPGDTIIFSHTDYKTKLVIYNGTEKINVAMEKQLYYTLDYSKNTAKNKLDSSIEKPTFHLPQYKNGNKAFYDSFRQKAIDLLKNTNNKSPVSARFTIDIDGKMKNPEVFNCVDPEKSTAIQQLLYNYKHWKPSYNNNIPEECTLIVHVLP